MDPRAVKKILVPTDFSELSGEAVATAVAFAKSFGATIDLVHVFVEPAYILPPPIDMATFPFDLAQILDRVQIGLDTERDRVKDTGVTVTTTTLSGRAAPEIVAHAKKTGADLIVMGTHGRSGFQHALLGSVAERVLRHSPCPVLVVPVRNEPA
jgi:nucleotide-binding universal stress UspA family protein